MDAPVAAVAGGGVAVATLAADMAVVVLFFLPAFQPLNFPDFRGLSWVVLAEVHTLVLTLLSVLLVGKDFLQLFHLDSVAVVDAAAVVIDICS